MDRGNALLEYAALFLVVVSLLLAVAAHGLPDLLSRELRGAVHRALGGSGTAPLDHVDAFGGGTRDSPHGAGTTGDDGATTGHEPAPGRDWRLDPAAAAEMVLRCARAGAAPDPLARADCALALLGLLDSEVLEATVLRLDADELRTLFLSRSFTATTAARAAVRLLWEHASEEVLRRLSRTRTFGFLRPFADSPHGDWVLVLVDVGGDHVRATIERNTASPRRTTRHRPVPEQDDQKTPRAPLPPIARRPAETRPEAVSMPSMPHSSAPDDQPPSPGERPNWLVSTLVVLVCLAVVASGWGAARLAVGGSLRPLDTTDAPESGGTRNGSAAEADPEDAGAYVEAAAELVEGSSAFHITFRVYGDGSGPQDAEGDEDDPAPTGASPAGTNPYAAGRGRAVYDSGAAPEFDHSFTTAEGQSVYRYDMGGGQLMMTADQGLELLDPPSTADRYLCSRDFGSAKLREVLDTSTDLAPTGLEEVRLEVPGQRGTHSAHRYTGTFTAMLGGYDPESGGNTLTVLEDAEFELWIDEQGYPRRLDYRAANGVGESYEYHSFN